MTRASPEVASHLVPCRTAWAEGPDGVGVGHLEGAGAQAARSISAPDCATQSRWGWSQRPELLSNVASGPEGTPSQSLPPLLGPQSAPHPTPRHTHRQ